MNDFEAWYEKTFLILFNYVSYKVSADSQEIEDICAAICMSALDNHQQYEPKKGSMSNWIFGIARNYIKNYYREQQRERNMFDPDLEEEIVSNSQNPEVSLLDKEMFVDTLKAIRTLPELEQEIIALRYGAGFSYREIAQQLNIPISSVGVSLHRAHKKIKAQIKLKNVTRDEQE